MTAHHGEDTAQGSGADKLVWRCWVLGCGNPCVHIQDGDLTLTPGIAWPFAVL